MAEEEEDDFPEGGSTRVDRLPKKEEEDTDGSDAAFEGGGTAVTPFPDQDDNPPTAFEQSGVSVDAEPPEDPPDPPPATSREGKAAMQMKQTLDLEEARQQMLEEDSLGQQLNDEPYDDGWGSPSEDTGSHTGSGIVPSQRQSLEPETGALQQIKQGKQSVPEEDADAPRLICIQGPDEGREFVLNGRDMSIGRAPDNDVVVNDPSVSRVHCRLLIDDGMVVATDQRSGNGTIVNGRRIERQTLASGNTLKLGQTLFRFVEMGDVIKSTETSDHQAEEEERSRITSDTGQIRIEPEQLRPRKERGETSAGRYAILIVLAAVVIGGGILVVALSGKPSNNGDKRPSEIAEEAFEVGKMALRAKSFDQAQEKLTLAVTAAPNEKRFKDELDLLSRERTNMASIAASHQLALSARFADATLKLDEAKDTLFPGDIAAAREEIRKGLLEACKKASEGLDKRPPEIGAAEDLVRNTGGALKDEPAVKALVQKLEQKTKRDEPAPQVVIERHSDPPKPKEEPEFKGNANRGISKDAQAALDMFIAGRLEAAVSQLQGLSDEPSVALKNKMLKFQDVYADARAAVSSKRADSEAAVKKAIAFESKIAQGRSTFVAELKRLQADALADSGTRLMAEQRYLDAYKAFKESVSMAPDQTTSKRKILEIQAIGRDTFNQGYILKDSDRAAARDKWTRVMAMLPPDDEVHQKAKKWLDQTK